MTLISSPEAPVQAGLGLPHGCSTQSRFGLRQLFTAQQATFLIPHVQGILLLVLPCFLLVLLEGECEGRDDHV